MKRFKKQPKPNALKRVKYQLHLAQLQATTAESRIHNLTTEAERAAQAMKDKNEAIAKRDESIRLLGLQVGAYQAERDRIVRIVDQFTSIQIIGHGQQLGVSSSASSSPGTLRKPVN